MITPKILYKYSDGDTIFVSVSDVSSRLIEEHLEKDIDALWEEQKNKCIVKGEKVWDGISYRMNSLTVDENSIAVELGPIKWSKRSTTRALDAIYRLPEDYWGKGVFVTGIIETTDGKYIFGERKNTALKRTVSTTIGGILGPDDVTVKSFDDFYVMLHKEIYEEIGVKPTLVTSERFLGIVYSRKTDVGFVFIVCVDLSSEEVSALFQKRSDDELASLKFVETHNVREHLYQMGDYWALIPTLMGH